MAALVPPAVAFVAAVLTVHGQFSDFAEFGTEIHCRTALTGDTEMGEIAVEVTLHQFGNRIATARLELAPYPESGDGQENPGS